MEPWNKLARSRVNAIHEGMITPLHSESDGEIESDETRAKWRSVFKNPKFQTLVRTHTHMHNEVTLVWGSLKLAPIIIP